MTQQVLQTSASPEIVVEQVGGDLRIHGWTEQMVTAQGDGALFVNQEENLVHVRCEGDCTIHAPAQSSLRIATVGGDGRIVGMQGRHFVGNVGGDLQMQRIGPTSVETVGGDLKVKRVDGDLSVQRVGGDASVFDVFGDCRMDQVGDDLKVSGVMGNLEGTAGDGVSLRLSPTAEHHYRVTAGGNLTLPRATAGGYHRAFGLWRRSENPQLGRPQRKR
ncbi:MAG: hypothetical protein HC802_19295 [Caldilineaceae bacterium]|nr:hypothetical protein [Caldilineaceae bacterium]